MKQKQRGMSFIGVLILVGLMAFAGVIGAQAVPTYVEYLAIGRAVKKAAAESTVQGVKSAFDRATTIDDIKSITGKDLEVTKVNNNVVVKFAYNKEIHIAGPAYLLLKYEGSSAP